MGTSVIDAFLVTLGLDGSAFKRGMEDAAKQQDDLTENTEKNVSEQEKTEGQLAAARAKRNREESKAAKERSDQYKTIRRDVLALMAVFTAGAGLKNFITDALQGAINVGYLSQNLDMSTQRINAWQRASERAGGSAEGITAQLKESADTLAQLNNGMGPNEGLQWFFRMGGSTDDLKSGNDYLIARSKIISEIFKTDPTKATLIAKQMGISEDQFDFLKQGPEAVQALVAAQEKNSAVTAKTAEEALKLKNKMLDLRDSLQATSTRILLQLAPSLEKLFAWLERGASWIADHKDDIAEWVDSGVKALTGFVKVANDVAQALGGWKNVLIGLAGLKLVGTVGSLLSLTTALGGVATAIGGVTAAGAGIPALVAAFVALSAYAGYKGAEYLFGDKPKPEDKEKPLTDINPPPAKLRLKSELRAEANRQRVEAGLPPLQDRVNLDSKDELRAEANRQRVEAGLPRLPEPVRPKAEKRPAPVLRDEPADRDTDGDEPAPRRTSAREAMARIVERMGIASPGVSERQAEPAEPRPMVPPKRKAAGQPREINIPPDQAATAQDVIAKLKRMGWTQAQAAGITASFVQESSLNPKAVNLESGATGLGQWLGSRKKDFQDWAGKPLQQSSLDEQLRFFQHEVTKGKEQAAGRLLRATKTPEDAARVHSEKYERPGEEEADVDRRQRIARKLDEQTRAISVEASVRMPVGAPAAAPVSNDNRKSSTSTTEVKIGQVSVNTQATDAAGIARDIGQAVERYSFTQQANTGMS